MKKIINLKIKPNYYNLYKVKKFPLIFERAVERVEERLKSYKEIELSEKQKEYLSNL